jgi:hypothetical protein
MTMKDLRDSIRNKLGLNKLVDASWKTDNPPGETLDRALADERAHIEQDYMKLSHVFFNTAQQPDYASRPDNVRARARAMAQKAWQRLKKGEDFARVVQDCTEDAVSRPSGGSLGCIPKDIFGPRVDAEYEKLPPGAFSEPVESPWGFHILRRDAIEDRDILEMLQAEYKEKKLPDVYTFVQEQAKVECAPAKP